MSERVDDYDRTIFFRFAEMEQGMAESMAISK